MSAELIATLEHTVRFPLGHVRVKLNRTHLSLGNRGGFEAFWVAEQADTLSPEAYRDLLKTHLSKIYYQQEQILPSKITLNLASHQLLDDIEAWTKLNYAAKVT
jgi:hypothetical protein